MKTLGLIGGSSWVSTVDYYSYINKLTNERLGALNHAQMLLYSINMQDLKNLSDTGDWDRVGDFFSGIAKKLESAGAEAILLCANTPHITAPKVRANINIPLIHIAEETAKEICRHNLDKVALLGTKYTMEHHFYPYILAASGIETLTPDADDREFIHWSIYAELGKNILTEETRNRYVDIISKLQAQGAQGVILGCTEIPLLIKPENSPIITFDTTYIHSKAAVDFALS
jgi:aspartate racemase